MMQKKNKLQEGTDSQPPNESVRVLLVEDSLAQRLGYAQFLKEKLGFNVVSTQTSQQGALSWLAQNPEPQLLFCDLKLPPSDHVREGIYLISAVLHDHPGIHIIAYSQGLTDWALMRLVEWGISCFHTTDWGTQSPSNVKSAMELILEGYTVYSPLMRDRIADLFNRVPPKPPLTLHPMRVAAYHLQAHSEDEISRIVGSSVRTIKNHITDIYRIARVDRTRPDHFNKLLKWYEELCAEYDFEFDRLGEGINLEKWVWPSRKKPV